MKIIKIILQGILWGIIGAIVFFIVGMLLEIEFRTGKNGDIDGTITAALTIGGAIFMALGGVFDAIEKYKKQQNNDNANKYQRRGW
ncbi:MAG: hypothetical protein RMJ97_04365 [Raineya sp.]|nr:hypothetical protein [Raineya sp.]MDW8296099.1 hypothetical protein [Raineya sp.]